MAQRKKKPKVTIRRPRKAKAAAVEQFVSGDAQASGRSGAQAAAIVERKNKPARHKSTVYMPPELARRLKIFAVTEGLEISEVVTAAVAEHLETRGG